MEKEILKCVECKFNPVPAYRKIYCDGCAFKKNAAFTGNPPKPGTVTDTIVLETAEPEVVKETIHVASGLVTVKKDNGFALTIGTIRSNALEIAYKIARYNAVVKKITLEEVEPILKLAKEFEKYIVTGE